MDRSKVIAVVTGAIALLLGIAYLVLVQVLDARGEMLPAPMVYDRASPIDLSTRQGAIVALAFPKAHGRLG